MDFTNISESVAGSGSNDHDHEHVHLHITQTGRKYKTSISGLIRSETELTNILKKLKKDICNCNGSIEHNEKGDHSEKIIVLFGDQREKVVKYLTTGLTPSITRDKITIHGA